MTNEMNKLTLYTRKRGRGNRMTAKERSKAKEAFLSCYAENGNIRLACLAANVSRGTFYIWLEMDEEFSIQYHTAEKQFADLALAEFRKRAMEGYEKPVISMGRVVFEQIPMTNKDGTPRLDEKGRQMVQYGKPLMERVVSDNLLAMLVKRHFPEYREKNQMEHSGSIDITGAKDTLLQRLATFAQHEHKEDG